MAEYSFDEFCKKFESLPEYVVEIGVFEDTAERKEPDVTNAELMFIHEYGSPLMSDALHKRIPSRPVCRLTKEWGLTKLDSVMNKMIRAYIENDSSETALEKELEAFCLQLQKHARRIIYDNDGTLKENASSTIARKGYNHPLFQTGQLARSLTARYRVIR